jgi:hypothetical protein
MTALELYYYLSIHDTADALDYQRVGYNVKQSTSASVDYMGSAQNIVKQMQPTSYNDVSVPMSLPYAL